MNSSKCFTFEPGHFSQFQNQNTTEEIHFKVKEMLPSFPYCTCHFSFHLPLELLCPKMDQMIVIPSAQSDIEYNFYLLITSFTLCLNIAFSLVALFKKNLLSYVIK